MANQRQRNVGRRLALDSSSPAGKVTELLKGLLVTVALCGTLAVAGCASATSDGTEPGQDRVDYSQCQDEADPMYGGAPSCVPDYAEGPLIDDYDPAEDPGVVRAQEEADRMCDHDPSICDPSLGP